MSYILDALKKSEQERGHETAPGIHTTHSSSLNYHISKKQWWPYVLITIVSVNLAALLYFIVLKDDSSPGNDAPTMAAVELSGTESVRTVIAKQPEPRIEPATTKPSASLSVATATVQKPGTESPETRLTQTAIPAPVANTSSQQESWGQVIERDELPTVIQQHIPFMEFSAHVYSSNPVQRSIIINGRLLEEGDYFASDMLLTEITPQGAIFDFQGYRFHQGVISSWN